LTAAFSAGQSRFSGIKSPSVTKTLAAIAYRAALTISPRLRECHAFATIAHVSRKRIVNLRFARDDFVEAATAHLPPETLHSCHVKSNGVATIAYLAIIYLAKTKIPSFSRKMALPYSS
jgi:hypothetical protein